MALRIASRDNPTSSAPSPPAAHEDLAAESEGGIQVLIEDELAAASAQVPEQPKPEEPPKPPAFRPAAERPPGVRPGQRR